MFKACNHSVLGNFYMAFTSATSLKHSRCYQFSWLKTSAQQMGQHKFVFIVPFKVECICSVPSKNHPFRPLAIFCTSIPTIVPPFFASVLPVNMHTCKALQLYRQLYPLEMKEKKREGEKKEGQRVFPKEKTNQPDNLQLEKTAISVLRFLNIQKRMVTLFFCLTLNYAQIP